MVPIGANTRKKWIQIVAAGLSNAITAAQQMNYGQVLLELELIHNLPYLLVEEVELSTDSFQDELDHYCCHSETVFRQQIMAAWEDNEGGSEDILINERTLAALSQVYHIIITGRRLMAYRDVDHPMKADGLAQFLQQGMHILGQILSHQKLPEHYTEVETMANALLY